MVFAENLAYYLQDDIGHGGSFVIALDYLVTDLFKYTVREAVKKKSLIKLVLVVAGAWQRLGSVSWWTSVVVAVRDVCLSFFECEYKYK